MLRITEINQIDQFFELKDVWNRLLEKSRDKNIFLTWEYLSNYWKHFGEQKRLRILCIEDKNEIIAIAPLRQSHYGLTSLFGYEVIEPLGYRGLTPEGADYTGLILSKREMQCLRLFLNYLAANGDWEFIYLMDIPETSTIIDLLTKMTLAMPLKYKIEQGKLCPYVPVPDSMDIFLKGLSSKFRKNLRRCMRNLKKDYQRVILKRYDEFGTIEEAMKIFFELHQKRWKPKNIPGVFHTQQIRDFYMDVAKLFADNGWLSLYFLTANDEPIATQYCFEYQQKMYYALGGFNPDYSQYSVGNLISLKVIEKCIERGLKEYDLLKGGETYKFRYTAKYRRNIGIRFVNKKFTSTLYHWGIKTLKQAKIDKLIGRIPSFQ